MRLNDIVPRQSARRLARRISIYKSVELLLIAALAVLAARLVWAVVTPLGPMGAWRLNEPGVEEGAADILRGATPFFRLDPARPDAPAASVTSLNLTVFGIRLDSATGRGSAIIATPDGVQQSFLVGDEILPGVTLKAVAFDHITLVRGGSEEALFIDQSGGAQAITQPSPEPGAVPPPAPVAVADRGVAGAGQAVTRDELRHGIGFIPRIDGGKVTGLSVRPQGSPEIFTRVGLKEGDVVTQIGGRPVAGPQDVERLAASLAGGGSVSLSVERGAQVVPIAVTVKGQ